MSSQLSVAKPSGGVKRILFADFAAIKFNALIQLLAKGGIHAEAVTDFERFLARLKEEPFDVCVVNLLMGGGGPHDLMNRIRQSSVNRDLKIVVTSRQVQKLNIQNTIRAGAHDFVAEPFEAEHVYERILFHLTPKHVLETESYETPVASPEAWPYLNVLLEAAEMLSRSERSVISNSFFDILKRVAEMTASNRTSLVIVEAETNTGVVLASSDDPKFRDFPIALHKYPEILNVMHTGNFVMVEDVSRNSLTRRINEQVRSIAIGSLMVFPVRFEGEVTGVLTIRRPKATELPSKEIIRVLQALATMLAAHSNIRALLRRVYREYNKKAG